MFFAGLLLTDFIWMMYCFRSLYLPVASELYICVSRIMHSRLYSAIIKTFVSFLQDKVDAGLPTAIVSVGLLPMNISEGQFDNTFYHSFFDFYGWLCCILYA